MSNPNTAQRSLPQLNHLGTLARVVLLLSVCSLSALSILDPLTQESFAQTTENTIFNKMIRRAQESYKAKRYREAIKHFEDAMVLRADSNIHWNLSVCYYKLGDLPKALSHVNEYLRVGRLTPKMRQKAEARRAKLLSALEARLDSRPDPRSNPRSDIRPLPLADQNPRTGQSDGGPPDTTQSWSTPPSSPINSASVGVDSSSFTSRQKRGILWGGLGLGGAIIGVGAYFYADSIWSSRPSGGGADARAARDQAITTSWVGDGFLITGLICLTVGGLYYWSGPSSREDGRRSPGMSAVPPAHPLTEEMRAGAMSPRPRAAGSLTLNLLRHPQIRTQGRTRAQTQAQTQARTQAQTSSSSETVGAILGWRLTF